MISKIRCDLFGSIKTNRRLTQLCTKDYKGIKLPKSKFNKRKQIKPCWKIAHTKTSKLLGGTGTLNTFGQDTMIILPLSQKTVRGSNMSQRPLSWSTTDDKASNIDEYCSGEDVTQDKQERLRLMMSTDETRGNKSHLTDQQWQWVNRRWFFDVYFLLQLFTFPLRFALS